MSEPRVLTVDVAASEGTELELLIAMRDRVAVAITAEACLPRDLAALTRRLREITKDIDVIKAKEAEESGGGSVPDEPFDPEAI